MKGIDYFGLAVLAGLLLTTFHYYGENQRLRAAIQEQIRYIDGVLDTLETPGLLHDDRR